MPKRKILPDNPEVLKLIKEAHRKPIYLTPAEEAEWLKTRGGPFITKAQAPIIVVERRGKQVFRRLGRAGADYHEYPDSTNFKKAERDHLSTLAKIAGPPIEIGVKARQAMAHGRDARILVELERLAHLKSHAATAVADKLGCSPQHVRRLRARKKRT